jgi:small subunit ribosomal protein S2
MKDISLQELLEAGSHFGHQKRRWNPAMKDYIFGERDGVHIFDLAKTRDGLIAACEFVEKTAKSGGKILFIGTKRQASDIVKAEAMRVGMPYVSVRWMGGLFTNFSQLSKSMKKMADLKAKRAAGEFKKYTKKERLLLDRDIARLEKFFSGVSDMDSLPQAIFVVDTHKEEVVVKEAAKMGIPVVGIVDSNATPFEVDYVIPANDDAVKSIELIVRAVADAVEEGRKGLGGVAIQPRVEKVEKSPEKEVTVEVKPEVVEEIEEKVEKKIEEEKVEETKVKTIAKAAAAPRKKKESKK